MKTLVMLAGIGHLLLAAGSLTIPGTLGWRSETAKLNLLTRQVFWTYAGYIWVAHICFGLVSTLTPHLLLDGSPLAAMVCGFIALWWLARLIIHFVWFDRSARPPGTIYQLAEAALVAFFAGCAGVYAVAAWIDIRGGG